MVRVAIVTGSNKGIGFAVVRELCNKFDGDVLLCSRDQKRGEEAVAKLKKEGLNPLLASLDIDSTESIGKFRDFVKEKYGGIDVLVNNAAIAYPGASTVPFPEQARNTLRINFFRLMEVCDALFPLLRPHARVVNVSSSCGLLSRVHSKDIQKRFNDPEITRDKLVALVEEYFADVDANVHTQKGWPSTAYATSKVAVTALTVLQQRLFSQDSREDLIINPVHPGYVDTDMSNHKGPLTIEEGAKSSVFAALIPPNAEGPKGQMIWSDCSIVDWTTFSKIV